MFDGRLGVSNVSRLKDVGVEGVAVYDNPTRHEIKFRMSLEKSDHFIEVEITKEHLMLMDKDMVTDRLIHAVTGKPTKPTKKKQKTDLGGWKI